jgi:hypothetical protein
LYFFISGSKSYAYRCAKNSMNGGNIGCAKKCDAKCNIYASYSINNRNIVNSHE